MDLGQKPCVVSKFIFLLLVVAPHTEKFNEFIAFKNERN